MYAAANLFDALHATRRYLGALGLGGWLKLGLVVLLIGGFGITSQTFNVPIEPETIDEPSELLPIVGFGAIVLGIYGLFRYLAAVLEFVFVESLRSEAVRIRRDLRANLGRGLWLLAFRAALWIGFVVAIAASIVAVLSIADVTAVAELGELTTAQIAAMVLSTLGLFVLWYGVDLLTTAFVVPIMLHEECGPIAAWRRFASSMSSNPVDLLAFLVVAWILGAVLWAVLFGIGFVVGIAGVLAVAVLVVGLDAVHSSLAVLGLVALVVGYVVYQYLVALFEAPVRSYVRYYALLLLGDTDSTLDLVSKQRAAIRTRSEPVAEPDP